MSELQERRQIAGAALWVCYLTFMLSAAVSSLVADNTAPHHVCRGVGAVAMLGIVGCLIALFILRPKR